MFAISMPICAETWPNVVSEFVGILQVIQQMLRNAENLTHTRKNTLTYSFDQKIK